MDRIKRYITRFVLLVAGILLSAPLTFAEEGKGITWQDYTQATAAAKKSGKPVLIDFWRPG